MYGADLPTTRGVVVHEVVVSRDGPTVSVRFDLAEFPDKAPPKWVKALANTVQVTLAVDGVDELTLSGASNGILGDLELAQDDAGVTLTFVGEGVQLCVHGRFTLTERISAYRQEDPADVV